MGRISQVADYKIIRVDNKETFRLGGLEVIDGLARNIPRERTITLDLPADTVFDESAIIDFYAGQTEFGGGSLTVQIGNELGTGWTQVFDIDSFNFRREIIGRRVLGLGPNGWIRFRLGGGAGQAEIRHAVLWSQRKVAEAPTE
jgi:hypothetical protein